MESIKLIDTSGEDKSSPSFWTSQPSFVSKEGTEDGTAACVRQGYSSEPTKFVLQCKCFWRLRSSASLNSECVGSIRRGTELTGVLVPEDVPQTYGEWFVRITKFEKSSLPLVHGASGTLPRCPVYCLYRNSRGSGLVELKQLGPGVDKQVAPSVDRPPTFNSKPADLSVEDGEDELLEQKNATEEIPLTWKLLGQVEGIVQYFTRLAGPKEIGITETMKEKYIEKPSDAFAKRQRKLFTQAAQRLKEVVGELDGTARTACVRNAFTGLSKDVQCAFQRLHSELEETAVKVLEIERQERPWRAEATMDIHKSTSEGLDLQHFLRLCHVLELTSRKPEEFREAKQHLVTFSQRYCQDLEQQCHNLRRRRSEKAQAQERTPALGVPARSSR